MKLGTRLKQEREAQNLTQPEISKISGLSVAAISNLENRDSGSSRRLTELARALGVTPHWLQFGTGEKYAGSDKETSNDTEPFADYVEVHESAIVCTKGNSYRIEVKHEIGVYLKSWFAARNINPDRCIRVMVDGDSMQPLLYHGDTVLINLDDTRITDGGVYGLKIDDGFYIRRLANIAGLGIKVLPLNPAYEVSTLDNERFKNRVQIIGRVCDKSGLGGL
jgi:phage repressor protein C with HTH and peptisase S24 domain